MIHTFVEEQIALVLYGGWFALSVARQLQGPVRKVIVRWDLFRLIPSWSFFAFPTRHDFTFIRRFRRTDGSLTSWEPIGLASPRPRGAFLWHPQLLSFTVGKEFASQAACVGDGATRQRVVRSARYGLLVAFLSANAPFRDAVAMQFIVYASRQFDVQCPRQIVFLSEFHEI